jgi:hypothetical protein
MKKWNKYKCYCITWWWTKEDCWDFEIITLTNKTCKLKEIREPVFWYIDRFYKVDKETRKKIREITLRTKESTQDYIKEQFVRYDRWCWMPFIFEIIQ